MAIAALLLTGFAGLLALPTFVLAVEVAVAITNRSRLAGPLISAQPNLPVRTTILMPAHNEEVVIAATLDALMPTLPNGFDVLVVADNCSDATAALSRKSGAEVTERNDKNRRGKGYALAHGQDVLKARADAPEVVLVLDADCSIDAASLRLLSVTAQVVSHPVQALDLLSVPPDQESTKLAFSTFAVVMKNLVRAKGMAHLGQFCQVMGTGTAFPWSIFAKATLASGHIVEDMELGVSLAMGNKGALFCEAALVKSQFPIAEEAQTSQRTRWEHGHLQTITQIVPKNLAKALITLNGKAVILLLDLAVPPLSFLVMSLVMGGAITILAGVIGLGWLPFTIISGALVLLVISIACAWHSFGREAMPARHWRGLFRFLASKLPIYARLAGKRQIDWVRTARDD